MKAFMHRLFIVLWVGSPFAVVMIANLGGATSAADMSIVTALYFIPLQLAQFLVLGFWSPLKLRRAG